MIFFIKSIYLGGGIFDEQVLRSFEVLRYLVLKVGEGLLPPSNRSCQRDSRSLLMLTIHCKIIIASVNRVLCR